MKPFKKQWEKCACGCPLKIGGEGETKYCYCPKCEPELGIVKSILNKKLKGGEKQND